MSHPDLASGDPAGEPTRLAILPPPRVHAAMPQEDTLDRIPRGTRVRVLGVLEGADAESDGAMAKAIARRLGDLGIRQGVEVEVIRRAPLGDPTVFELHGYQLCLRRSESSRVRVEPAAAHGATG